MRFVVALAFVACSHVDERQAASAAPKPVIDRATTQLVTAIVPDWTSTTAELRLWKRDGNTWRAVGEPWQAVVGKSGSAWGSGVHGAGIPAGRTGPVKREGDGKSPAGVFSLRAAFGYADKPPPGTLLHYTPLDEGWRCVDDPRSAHYAEIVDQRTVSVDWKSAEEMRRKDELYTWVVDVGHNPARRAGDGSCIFLHVWHGAQSSTVGCTAMAEPQLTKLIASLDPKAAPVYVLLPRAEYDALASAWGLPAR